jgi:hypothetical protein
MDHVRLALLFFLQAPLHVPAAPSRGANDALLMIATFISQVKVNGFSAWAIQQMKSSKAPALSWISQNTPWVTRAVALLAAALTHIGVHWTFTGTTLVVTGLSLTAIVGTLYQVAQNYLFQHAWWKVAFSTPVPATVPVTVTQATAKP